MKKLLTSILIFAVSITVGWSQTAPANKVAHNTWVAVITPETSKHYLDSVSTAWKKNSFDLKFTKLEYNAAGMLVKIAGSVNYMSKSGIPSATFNSDNLQVYKIVVDDIPSVTVGGK